MKDVFKFLKESRKLLESTTSERAAELGYEYRARGVWGDPRTGKRYRADGNRFVEIQEPKKQEKDPKAQEPKTLSQFKKEVPQQEPVGIEEPPVSNQMGRVVPGGPTETVLSTGNRKEVIKQLSRGRESVMSPARKKQISQQADDMITKDEPQIESEDEAQEPEGLDDLLSDIRGEEPKKTPKPISMGSALKMVKEDKVKEKTGELDSMMKDEPSAENVADIQDTMLELRKLAGKQATEAVQKSEAKYAKYMDKVFKPFEDLVSKMDDQKKNSFVPLVANAHKFTGRSNSGAGLNSLGKFDVEQLALGKKRMFDNYDFDDKQSVEKFVRSVRGNEVDDEFVDSTFEILPKKLKQTWGKKGMAGKGELGRNHFLGYDKDGNEMRGQGGVDRAKYVWRMYLEQGGVDAYTGLPLNIDNIDLEHIRPASKAEGDLEEFKTREHEKNWVLVNANVNQAKSDLSMREFFERQVDPLAAKEESYWETRSQIFDYRNSIPSKESELMGSFVDKDGNIVDGMTGDVFMEMMENHEADLKKTKKELGVGADASGDKEIKDAWKSIETQSKLAKELITALGLPRGYNKQKNVEGSKPRSNSMGSDNYYRGVFLSMVGKSPEEQNKIKGTYRDAIRYAEDSGGGDAAFASYMVENGGVDMERIGKYKALSKMFKTIQESIEFGKYFLSKYNKNNRFI